jgi:hypothetical protein
MVARVLGRLADLVDHVLRRPHVGVAHAEVDDVLAGPSARPRHVGHHRQDVGGQPIQLVEIVAEFLDGLFRFLVHFRSFLWARHGMEGHRSGARRAAVSAMSSDPDRAGSRARPGDTPRDRCIRSSAHRFSAP